MPLGYVHTTSVLIDFARIRFFPYSETTDSLIRFFPRTRSVSAHSGSVLHITSFYVFLFLCIGTNGCERNVSGGTVFILTYNLAHNGKEDLKSSFYTWDITNKFFCYFRTSIPSFDDLLRRPHANRDSFMFEPWSYVQHEGNVLHLAATVTVTKFFSVYIKMPLEEVIFKVPTAKLKLQNRVC